MPEHVLDLLTVGLSKRGTFESTVLMPFQRGKEKHDSDLIPNEIRFLQACWACLAPYTGDGRLVCSVLTVLSSAHLWTELLDGNEETKM